MGRPKAFIELDGATLLDRAVAALTNAGAQDVVVVGGDGDRVRAAGHRFVADEHPGEGPLGGILTALESTEADVVVVLACDLVDASPLAVASLVGALGTADVAVPEVEGRSQWLHAAWRRSAVEALRAAFERAADSAGLPLHDQDRRGDKGFRYAGPGFWATPEGEAMRQHFMDAGDPETAAWFRRSSMGEAMRTSPGESPLCVVTELPMFRISAGGGERQRGVASHAVAFREAMPGLLADASDGVDLQPAVERFGITCPDLATQVRVHLKTLDAALAAIG